MNASVVVRFVRSYLHVFRRFTYSEGVIQKVSFSPILNFNLRLISNFERMFLRGMAREQAPKIHVSTKGDIKERICLHAFF